MKRYFYVAIFTIAALKTYAQTPEDALRFSWTTAGGTARNQAIGGAGVSLGGEFSTIGINPAGLGLYKTIEFVFTPAFQLQNFKGNYRDSLGISKRNNLSIGASGLILAFKPSNDQVVKNFTLGLSINRAADFNSNIYYKGINNKSSYADKFLEELQDNNVSDPNRAASDYPYGTSLAFNTYLVDTVHATDGSIAGYRSVVPLSTGVLQENKITTKGGITDLAIGGAVNLLDKLYIGGTLSFPYLHYNKSSNYKESDITSDSKNNFNYFEVNENLDTRGYGVNGKIGFIYKPIEYFRLGLAVHSPTYFELTDKYSTEVITDLEGYGGAGVKSQSSKSFNNGESAETKYNYQTPWRFMAGASYVFRETEHIERQRAFLTADIEYVDYGTAKFKPTADDDVSFKTYYNALNKVIRQQYKGAFNFRVGGELKFNTWMFRLGGAYYGNPYKSEKGEKYRLTTGLGYRDKGFFIDLAYGYTFTKDVNYPYRLDYKTNEAATIRNSGADITATVGFKLW